MIASNLAQIHARRLAGLEVTGLAAVLEPRVAANARYVHFEDGEPIEGAELREKPAQPAERRRRGQIRLDMLEVLRGADWINGPEIARRAHCNEHSIYLWLRALLREGEIEHDGRRRNRCYRLKRSRA